MSIKIAVIGSSEFIDNILTIATQIADIEIVPYIYQEPEEAAELVKTMKPCDVVFFSGALPYFFARKYREKLPIPSIYRTTDEMAVATSLLSIFYNYNTVPERISIDLIDSSVVTNVLEEIELNVHPLNVLEYRQMIEDHFNLAEIVSFHQTLWKQGKIDLALTSIHAVYDRLQSLGVPAMRITDPKISLIRCLQEAKAQAELFKSKAAQVAVGYISANVSQEYLHAFARKIHASVQYRDESLFVVYTTRGNIEALLEQDLLYNFLKKSQVSVKVGFGYGATIAEAEQNAKVALQFSEKDSGDPCGYILTENKELLGPFPLERKQHRLKNDHPKFLSVAKQTKLSPANLSKIMEFSKSRQSLHFTAADLSDYLQITRRSTERILKKLLDHGYVRVVGEEMTYQQGRPRAIYELNMPVYQ